MAPILPSLSLCLLLISGIIVAFSGFQSASVKAKSLRVFLSGFIAYLTLPLIINNLNWSSAGPPVLPALSNTGVLAAISGLKYCEAAADPHMSSDEFIWKLYPYIKSSPISIPYSHPELLLPLSGKKTQPPFLWELYPPSNHCFSHVQDILNTADQLPQEQLAETITFLLLLGNQLTSLNFPQPFNTGIEILRSTLLTITTNPTLATYPKIVKEIEKVTSLPTKLTHTQKNVALVHYYRINASIWDSQNKTTLKSLLINPNELYKYRISPLDDNPKRILRLLATGQLYHLYTLYADQKPPSQTDLITSIPPANILLSQKLSQLAQLILEKSHETLP